MFGTHINAEKKAKLNELISAGARAGGRSINPFGDRSIPQAMGGDFELREIIISQDVMPEDFNASTPHIHGYFSDDATCKDLYPNIWLTHNHGVLRGTGSHHDGSRVFAFQSAGFWWIVSGEFETSFKAKVKTADISPDNTNACTLYWDDFNAVNVGLISSGKDVQAFNRLTSTVEKNEFVELQFNVNDYIWYIVGASDVEFLVNFELKNNFTPGGSVTAYKFFYNSTGAIVDNRVASQEITVFDPLSQFRGVGQSVRSAGGSRGVARWVEGASTARKYQIVSMQSPALVIKYTTSGAVAKTANSISSSTIDIISPIDAFYVIGRDDGGTFSIWKDTTFAVPSGYNGYAIWNQLAGRYEALPVPPSLTTITVLTAHQADGTTKKLQYKSRTIDVYNPGTESGWTDEDVGVNC